MAVGRRGRSPMELLLTVNFVVYLIVLGLAGWSVDKYINGEQNHPHLGGNAATSFMLIFALIGGVIGACSVLAGFIHLQAWHSDSLANAASTAIISWVITALAFGFVCKEMILGGHRGKRLQTLEAFVAIASVSQFLYLVLLHSGMFNSRYGPAYRSYDYEAPGETGMAHEPGRSGTTAEYEAITNEPTRSGIGIASEYEATGITHELDERFDTEYEATGITHEPESSGTAAVVYR